MLLTEPKLILVGGFLGAGKTTWLLAAAARLQAAGKRAGVILNDQGEELVDARLARAAGFETEQVGGGCFCCRLSEFVRAAKRLPCPDVILAEPLGSCIDLVATVVRPLGRMIRVAPLTVLVDPARSLEDPLLEYLYRKQIAEADIVLLSRSDLNAAAAQPPPGNWRAVSAVTGEGLDDWLEAVLSGEAGARAVDVDYALYAKAEAELAWLDWRAEVRVRPALTPAALAGPLIENLDAALTRAGARIAHLKVFNQAGTDYIKASVCRNGDAPLVDGALDAPPSARHEIVLNLRAAAATGTLDAALDDCLARLPGRVRTLRRACFHPGAPVPESRMTEQNA